MSKERIKEVKKNIGTRVRDKILPYFVFPVVVGIVTGILIFIFKVTSSFVIHIVEESDGVVKESSLIFLCPADIVEGVVTVDRCCTEFADDDGLMTHTDFLAMSSVVRQEL